MRKHILLYGLPCGALIALLDAIGYRYLVVEHAVEIYGALIAAVFAALGIWLGLRLSPPTGTVLIEHVAREEAVREEVVSVPLGFVRDDRALASTGLSGRELEILELMAAGLSNREIAARIYISENTVKTHASRVFEKLGAKRRTEAVRIGRQRLLLP